MPIREYSCTYCDHFFEQLVTGDDYERAKCRCGSWADYVPSVSAPAQGYFGTVSRRTGKQNYNRFNGHTDKSNKSQEGHNEDDSK
jgi:putative FmdB family regulatory protein